MKHNNGSLLFHIMRIQNARGVGYNRRPIRRTNKGVIKDGSCTDIVLHTLQNAAPRSMTRSEIVEASQCKPKSVDWALHYLRSIRLVQSVSAMDRRSSIYLRYKATEDEHEKPIKEL